MNSFAPSPDPAVALGLGELSTKSVDKPVS